jgi:hypothetical protein
MDYVVRAKRHGSGCCQHEPNREQGNWPRVVPEVAPGREVGCRPKHWRQENEEYKVRLDTQARKARHQAHEETHKDKQHWVRNRKPSGRGHAEENTAKDQKDYLKRCGCHDSDGTPLSDEIGGRVIMFF